MFMIDRRNDPAMNLSCPLLNIVCIDRSLPTQLCRYNETNRGHIGYL